MSQYDMLMVMSLLGFGMMSASFHMCGMMLFSDMLYMLVRSASPTGLICLRCMMFCCVLLSIGLVLWLSVVCVFSCLHVGLCFDFFVECVCYVWVR